MLTNTNIEIFLATISFAAVALLYEEYRRRKLIRLAEDDSMTSVDKADWHNGSGEYPKDLPDENGGTHIGMYFAWIINNHMESLVHHDKNGEQYLQKVREREITGRDFLFKQNDGKFLKYDLNKEGFAFTKYYYGGKSPIYLTDYENILAKGLPSIYHVQDTWQNYDKIAHIISERYSEWKSNDKDAQ